MGFRTSTRKESSLSSRYITTTSIVSSLSVSVRVSFCEEPAISRLFAAVVGEMGNCQASAAAVVIHHPGNKVETLFWSVKASDVMNSNAGHYVALVVTSPAAKSENGTPLRQIKLLRPEDMLLVGNVYRLVSFEDVLKEFAAKKTVRLGKGMKGKREVAEEIKKKAESPSGNSKSEEEDEDGEGDGYMSSRRSIYRGGQWKPSLQSIAEARA